MAKAERVELLNVPMEKIYKAILDFTEYPSFVSGVKETKIIEKVDEKKSLVHFTVEFMTKKITYSLEIQSDLGDGEAHIHWSLKESEFMKVNNGSWKLKKRGEGQTEVIYSLELDLTFPVPSFIMSGAVKNSLPGAIKEFGERAKKV